jgi:glycerol-3-phosphate dehydrogenase
MSGAVNRLPARSPRCRFDRESGLARLAEDRFDVLVVGGGITGAGVALDAAARGLHTALIDKGDFGQGTSSRSSKLVHGGLRYLHQRDVRLVYQALAERQLLLTNAPHLVSPLPFLIPLFGRGDTVDRSLAKGYSTALWMYDLTGGLRIGRRHRRVTAAEAAGHFPDLDAERLVAGFLYWDAHADDARLTLTVARTAVLDHGAVAANHAELAALIHDDSGRVRGGRLTDGTEIRADAVVNAGGVWADRIRGLGGGPSAPPTLRPAKGIHLVLRPGALGCDVAAVLPVPGDRRSIFVIPWEGRTYVGTTDTDYDGPLDDPQCTPDDVAYLLGGLNAVVGGSVSPADVAGSWAGLRPLASGTADQRTADLSRRHRVTQSADGLVTVTGGKLTTYRRMAADTVDRVGALLGRRTGSSPTRHLALLGAEGTPMLRRPEAAERFARDQAGLGHLVGRYGSEARTLVAMVDADPELGRPLVPGLPYLRAEALYAARYEMAHTLEDVLARRTRAMVLARDASAAAAVDVAHLLATELGWSPERVEDEVDAYREAVTRSRLAAGLAGTSSPVRDPR